MNKKTKTDLPDAFLWLKDAPPQPIVTERFSAEQMIECEKCSRKNPPTRLACMYCGSKLIVSEEQAAHVRPTLRKLETWEKGWNVIWLPGEQENSSGEISEDASKRIASFLRLEQSDLNKIIEHRRILPLARAETPEEAQVIFKYLQNNDLNVRIVSDANLTVDVLPKRVRSLEFGGSYLNLKLIGKEDEPVCLFYAEIELFVLGALLERQVENRERRKSEDRFEIRDSREVSSDESVLDFYPQNDSTGYRISMRSFDFSCLETEKKMFANENFKILLEKIRARISNAAFDDSYNRVRTALSFVWPLEQRNESLGWQRDGIGKFSIENRLTVSNAWQFMRYSRTLRELKK